MKSCVQYPAPAPHRPAWWNTPTVLTLGRRLTATLYAGLSWMLGKSKLKCPCPQAAILCAKSTYIPEALDPLQDLVPGPRTSKFSTPPPQAEWTTNQALEIFFFLRHKGHRHLVLSRQPTETERQHVGGQGKRMVMNLIAPWTTW